MMKRILVTGGAGFIGKHLVEKLVKAGHRVTIIDDFSTGTMSPKINGANLIRKDVAKINWPKLMNNLDVKYNEIYWLASPASPPAYMENPQGTFNANVVGLKSCINKTTSDTRILFASTSEIYGDPLEHPQSESYFGNVNTLGPRAIYDESKRMGETLLATFSENYVIARIFNTYGPGMLETDGRLITNIFSDMRGFHQFHVFGTGTQTRSMCFVDDTVRGLISIMEKGAMQQHYNVGNPEEYKVLDIIRTCEEVTDIKIGRRFKKALENDPMMRKPIIDKITSSIGWKPEVSLKEGLEIMWKEFDGR